MTETPRSTAVEHAVLGEACKPDGQWRSKMEAIAQRFTVTHKKPPIAPFIAFRAFLALPRVYSKIPNERGNGCIFPLQGVQFMHHEGFATYFMHS
jgi:hypothetical protein